MLIGLTGGIACGKTTVAEMLSQLGALVVDADQVARDVVAPGSEGLDALSQAFGPDVLDPSGHLDREALGRRVFADESLLKTLNEILHPRIAMESLRQIQEAMSAEPPLVVYDAALLIETGREDDFRPLVVVTTTPQLQQARLMARDHLSAEEAIQRINSQMPVAEKAALADHVIKNDLDREDTRAQVLRMWTRLTGRPFS